MVLVEALGAGFVALSEVRRAAGRAAVMELTGLVTPRPVDPSVAARLVRAHPLAQIFGEPLTRLPRAPWSVGDLVGEEVWRASESHALLRGEYGVDGDLTVPIRVGATTARSLVVGRADGGFSERDRAYAGMLQPLLARVDRMDDPPGSGTASPAPPGPHLTPRELVVLTLLREGATARAMASRLAISPRTVHKHIENLYRKLGTGDRLTTVLRAQTLGILPPPASPPSSAPRTASRQPILQSRSVRTCAYSGAPS
jgi:DNA-binding CsgD family transcriptional regulator